MSIAIVKDFSFKINFTLYDDYEKIINEYLNSKITFKKINSNDDLLNIVKSELLNNDTSIKIEELRGIYNDKQLLNYIVRKDELLNTEKSHFDCIIFYKRNIIVDDTYLFDHNINFNYQHVHLSDIVDILKRKIFISGLLVKTDGTIHEIIYNIDYLENMTGVINYKLNNEIKTIKYYDPTIIFNNDELLHKDLENQLNENENNTNSTNPIDSHVGNEFFKQIDHCDVEWALAQREMSLGIINLFYLTKSNEHNTEMSKFFKMHVRGDVIISLFIHNSMTDINTYIELTEEIYNKMLLLENKEISRENKKFFNFYYELLYNLNKS